MKRSASRLARCGNDVGSRFRQRARHGVRGDGARTAHSPPPPRRDLEPECQRGGIRHWGGVLRAVGDAQIAVPSKGEGNAGCGTGCERDASGRDGHTVSSSAWLDRDRDGIRRCEGLAVQAGERAFREADLHVEGVERIEVLESTHDDIGVRDAKAG